MQSSTVKVFDRHMHHCYCNCCEFGDGKDAVYRQFPLHSETSLALAEGGLEGQPNVTVYRTVCEIADEQEIYMADFPFASQAEAIAALESLPADLNTVALLALGLRLVPHD